MLFYSLFCSLIRNHKHFSNVTKLSDNIFYRYIVP